MLKGIVLTFKSFLTVSGKTILLFQWNWEDFASHLQWRKFSRRLKLGCKVNIGWVELWIVYPSYEYWIFEKKFGVIYIRNFYRKNRKKTFLKRQLILTKNYERNFFLFIYFITKNFFLNNESPNFNNENQEKYIGLKNLI